MPSVCLFRLQGSIQKSLEALNLISVLEMLLKGTLNLKLACRVALVSELSELNQPPGVFLSASNLGLACRVALVSELSEENAKLAEENRQINVSIRKVLEDNAELTNRLIEIALRNEEGGDAIFGTDGRSPKAAGGVANTILSTSQEDMQKRRNELAEQVENPLQTLPRMGVFIIAAQREWLSTFWMIKSAGLSDRR